MANFGAGFQKGFEKSFDTSAGMKGAIKAQERKEELEDVQSKREYALLSEAATSGMNMNRLYSIGEASKALGVSITTLRRREVEGRLIPEHTAVGHRGYDLAKLKPEVYRSVVDTRQMVAYARMSSHDKKKI